MKKFVFKLQPLLSVKMQMEDNLKNELGKAIQELERNNELLKFIENKKEAYINKFNSKTRGKTLLKDLREYSTYILHLNSKLEQQKENVKSAQKNVDKIREELTEVMKERRVLEKLREKKYKQFLNEQLKEEQKLSDEIVNYKHSKINKI